MTIPNFHELFDKATFGDRKAVRKWLEHTDNDDFDDDELLLAITDLDKMISTPGDYPKLQQSYALYLRADMHEKGLGYDFDYPEAIKLYTKAADEYGNTLAMMKRAKFYSAGCGEPDDLPNEDAANKMYEKAILAGDSAAMVWRGYRHEFGIGGDINTHQAYKLYKEASSLGESEAMARLADLITKGVECKVNYIEALRLYNKAIELDNTHAKEADLDELKRDEEHTQRLLSELKKDPGIINLFDKIKKMELYAQQLFDSYEIQQVYILAVHLNNKLTTFLEESSSVTPNQKDVDQFKDEFIKLLDSNEQYMHENRKLWVPIVKNILIALTGIGFLLILAKIAANAIDSYQKNIPMSFNQSLFFTKTKSQELAEEIGESMKQVKVDTTPKVA